MKETKTRYLVVGEVRKAWGIAGEVQVKLITDFPKRLAKQKTLYVGQEARALPVESARLHSGSALIKFSGIDTPEEAAKLSGQVLQIPVEDAAPLRRGQYYHHQVIGLEVFTEEGERIGRVAEILETGANDVYIVERADNSQALIPAIRDVIREIDLDAQRMTINPIPGLIE